MTNVWIAILVAAVVSYAIRVLPLTLIRRPIENVIFRSFLYGDDLPGHHPGHRQAGRRDRRFGGGRGHRLEEGQPHHRGSRLLRGGVPVGACALKTLLRLIL